MYLLGLVGIRTVDMKEFLMCYEFKGMKSADFNFLRLDAAFFSTGQGVTV